MGVSKPRPKPGSPRFRPGNAGKEWPAAKNPKESADVTDLAGQTPEQMVQCAAPEAIAALISIMRKPGRNAGAQLRAAETLMRYGVSAPAQKQEITGSGGGPLRGTIEIVMVTAKTEAE